MKKALSFIEICAYAVGAIGGFGYAMYCKAYFIGICVVALAAMAFPELKRCFQELSNPS